jgi:hypothetical protein
MIGTQRQNMRKIRRIQMKVNSLFLADIHFGVRHTPHMFDELMAIIPKTLIENDIKILFIAGDYFDKELVGSHKYYATKFFANIASICNDNKIILRMIKGTISHEQNQLVGFFGSTKILLPDLDFKIVNTVEEEEILGLKVLYIPEEPVLDQTSYYEPFKQRKYNIIVGHGTWDFVDKSSFLLGNNSLEKMAPPVHLVKEWDDVLEKGFCVFGHIHNAPEHKNKYFYTGSFSRWVYGEEKPKGFLISETDTDTLEYNVTFIENELAPKYQTMTFEDAVGFSNLKEQSILDVRRKLKELVDKNSENRVRINVTDLTPTEIVLLQKAASTIDSIDLSIESKKMEEILLEEQEENNMHDYVIHPEKYGLRSEDVIIRFAKENNNEDILMSDLQNIINS